MKRSGFALMEIIVVFGMIATIVGLVTINLAGSQRRASLVEAVDTFAADVKDQQTKAMSGFMVQNQVPAGFGVYIEPDAYTLFSGGSYDQTNPSNSVIFFSEPIQAEDILFPNQTILFASKSGEIVGYNSAQDSVTIAHTESGQSRRIELNALGVIESID
jgi:type II secretory pathway pseudopilin PulG